jgi:hypothetical protein
MTVVAVTEPPGYFAESVENRRGEVLASALLENAHRLFEGERLLVGPVRCQGINNIRDGEDAP